MAGFEVTLYGRIWVTPKGNLDCNGVSAYGVGGWTQHLCHRGQPFLNPTTSDNA
jgi:hypothetical protein